MMRRRQRGQGDAETGTLWSLWPDATPPAGAAESADGGTNFETATEIGIAAAGRITHIRVLDLADGTIDGALFRLTSQSTGTLLGVTATVAATNTDLYRELALPGDGVAVAAGDRVVAALRSSTGRYWAKSGVFTAEVATGPLTGAQSGHQYSYPNGPDNAINGRFAGPVGTPGGTLPVSQFNQSSYYVDVVLVEE